MISLCCVCIEGKYSSFIVNYDELILVLWLNLQMARSISSSGFLLFSSDEAC